MNRVMQILGDIGEEETLRCLLHDRPSLLRRPNFGRKSLVSVAVWAWRLGHIDTPALREIANGQRAQVRKELTAAEFTDAWSHNP